MMKNAELIALALAVVAAVMIYRARPVAVATARGPSTVPLDPTYWNSHENF